MFPDFNVQNVRRALETSEWYPLGMQLGVSKETLDIIERMTCGGEQQKFRMIATWLKTDRHASWSKLCDSLKALDENVLALKIEQDYCPV